MSLDIVMRATNDPNSRFGRIIRAAKGEPMGAPQTFGNSAIVTSDGYLMCDFVDSRGDTHMGAFVCHIDEINENIRGITRFLSLSEAEFTELVRLLGRWIKQDYRTVKPDYAKGQFI